MGEFIEAIAGNIFVLLALVAGLVGFFQKEKREDESEQRRPNRPTPRPNREQRPSREQVTEARETLQEKVSSSERFSTEASNKWYEAMEDSKAEREESLSDMGEAIGKYDGIQNTIKRNSLVDKDRTYGPNVSIKKNLNKKRIIEGFIMSEVLAEPKAKRRKNI
ncbi:hypothetical protein CEY16_04575 [Halalkalibacillus sediminis]|uniref:Uncharacterized protein n=1 Tax=Halalkalibacillus sediminis TaxID=2018042 RepID=A0A2I0QY49_9BACI|nr:hypothetical protein [Halalkalibacillus sediminis]PKR79030.1 hypothetical protein CEY16_04575 [Halalkalibacillus sediminis]